MHLVRLRKIAYLSPFLLGLYAPLSLLSKNAAEARLADGVRSILFSLLFAGSLLLFSRLVTKSWEIGTLLSSYYLLLFYSYGHAYQILGEMGAFGEQLARHRYLLPAWLLLFIAGTWLIIWGLKEYEDALRIVLITSLAAAVLPITQLAIYHFPGIPDLQARRVDSDLFENLVTTPPETKPDIYYIILDGYARDDTLRNRFDFDNSDFLESLEALGFYVAPCSRSNYTRTRLSLATSLNMAYLDTLGVSSVKTTQYTQELVRHSQVRRIFEQLGYKIVSFETNYYWTEWVDADMFLTNKETELHKAMDFFENSLLNDFDLMFLKTTAVRAYFDLSDTLVRKLFPNSKTTTEAVTFRNTPRIAHYNRTIFTLDTLPALTQYHFPKFVFAHIVSPHHPYVFGPNGEFLAEDPEDEFAAYRDQVIFLNNRIIRVLSEIIAESDTPPIIILQADHGPPILRRQLDDLKILNAYNFPNGGSSYLYPGITPVNSFRLLLDIYFGTHLGTLEDISHYSPTPGGFFDFATYPDDRPGCSPEGE
jgi:hypothetical protein